MLVSELTTEMLREQSEAQDDPNKVVLIEQWIKDALLKIGSETDWKFFQSVSTFPTVAGTPTYNLPATHREIRSLRIPATDDPIDYITVQQLVNAGYDLEQQNKPRFWYYQDVTTSGNAKVLRISLFPVPDAIYTIEAHTQIQPTTITSNSVLPVTDEMILALKELLRIRFYVDDKDWNAANRADKDYTDIILRLMSRDKRKRAANTRLKVSDIDSGYYKDRFARLDPNHYS